MPDPTTYGFMDGSSYDQNQNQIKAPNTQTPPVTSTTPGTSAGTPTGTSPSTNSNVITPDSINTTVPQATVPTPATPTPAVNTSNTAADALQQMENQANQDSQDGSVTGEVNSLTQSLAGLLGQDTGQTQSLIESENDAGVPALQQNLQDINNQIKQEQANQQQSDAQLVANSRNIETSGTLLPFAQEGQQKLAGDAAILRGLSNAKIGVLNAQALAAQGNINLAVQTAQNAVAAKYAPIEDQIKAYQAQITALTPLFDEEQKKQADALTLKNNLALQQISDQATQEKSNLSIAVTAGVATPFVNQNGNLFDSRTGQTFTNLNDFLQAAGVTSVQQAYQQGLITDISNEKLQDIQFAQQAQAKYPDVRIPAGSTPQEVAQILQGSRIYQKDTYIAPTGGTDAAAAQTAAFDNYDNYFVNGSKTDGLTGIGADGYASPQTYNAIRADAISKGYDAAAFDKQFAQYVNPHDVQDYNGAGGKAKSKG